VFVLGLALTLVQLQRFVDRERVVLRGADLDAFFAGLDAVVRRVDEVDAFFAGDLDVALAVDFVASLLDCACFRWLS
jgi:hypothetical protein